MCVCVKKGKEAEPTVYMFVFLNIISNLEVIKNTIIRL